MIPSYTKQIKLLILTIFLVSGCSGGNPNAPSNLSGKVTYKGQPLGGGTVQLIKDGSTEGSRQSMNINPDGTFLGTDLPEGEFAVIVETESAKGSNPAGSGGYKGKNFSSPVPKSATVVTGTYTQIPKKYNKKESSGIKITLKRGRNEQNFDLTD